MTNLTVFLDVDGTIRHHSHTGAATTIERSIIQPQQTRTVRGFPITIPEKIIGNVEETINWNPQVTEWFTTHQPNVIWLTGWGDQATKLNPIFGIQKSTVANWNRTLPNEQGKTQFIQNWIITHNNQPFIWCDDVATKFCEPFTHPAHLILTPKCEEGLTVEHLVRMTEFLKQTT